ncbi:MAG: hypothetical protein EPN57_27260 [Paraburkholderia sp.]|nr:MAG: hypothetical protein EPN57_27260 [Paraburkholderia sp.]
MTEGIDPAGKGWRALEPINGSPNGNEEADVDPSPLPQSGWAFLKGLKKYKRADLSVKSGSRAGKDDVNEARSDESSFALAPGADVERVARGVTTNEPAAVSELPTLISDPQSISDERRSLQQSAQALPRIVESVDATLRETRSAYMRGRSEARLAARDLAQAIDVSKKAKERLANWYTDAVIDEVRGSFPGEIGPIDDGFAIRVATWVREPTVVDVAELEDYDVGAVGAGDPFDRLMEGALERVTSRENPEAARLHEAENVAYLEQRRAETTFEVLDGQLSRLHKRVLALQDASAAAHLTHEAVKAAREANSLVAEGEADTPASEQARNRTRLAQDMLGHLNGMLGAINDEMRS